MTENIIEKFELVKYEKSYNNFSPTKYFYSIQLSGINDILVFETEDKIVNNLVGKKIKYEYDEINSEVKDFDVIE